MHVHTRSSPIGPALHDEGGSLCDSQYVGLPRRAAAVVTTYRPKSVSSLFMRFKAMLSM